MLSIVFTTHKLLAGVHDQSAKILPIQTHNYIPFQEVPFADVLTQHLPEIQAAYQKWHKGPVESPIPTTLALPVGIQEETAQQLGRLIGELENPGLRLLYQDNLASAYTRGLQLPAENILVLECLEEYLNLCYSHPTEPRFSHTSFPEIGPRTGNERVLAELSHRFGELGLNIDEESRNDLLRQLKVPMKEYVFTLSRAKGQTSFEAEALFKKEEFLRLMSEKREGLAHPLNREQLREKDIRQILFLGQYLQNDVLLNYFRQDLQLGDLLLETGRKGPWTEFETIITGLYQQGKLILEEEERIRQEELERKRRESAMRAKISAELGAKQKRESLLTEIQEVCVDPDKVEEYESRYLAQGAELGIPEMIIKWNISEVLSKISLELTQEKLGEGIEDPAMFEALDAGLPALPPSQETSETVGKSEEAGTAQLNGQETTSESVPVEEDTATEATEEEAATATPEEPIVPEESTPTEITAEEPVVATSEAPVVPTESKEDQESTEPAEKETIAVAAEKKPEIVATSEEPVMPNEAAPTPHQIAETLEASLPTPPKVVQSAEPVSAKGNPTQSSRPVIKLSGRATTEVPVTPPINGPAVAATTQIKESTTLVVPGIDQQIQISEKSKASLNDLFSIKGTLPDNEFSTKRVLMKGDPTPKVVRVLKHKDADDPKKLAAFQHLYKKELAYYDEVSEITSAKEGLFYYREYFERHTLKQHVKRLGLLDKSHVDDLNSQDLKFILQIFKEVKDLPVSHADITEENILVIAKRKWNLQKNFSIHFVGFTSADCSQEQMIQQTHKMFGRLVGDKFYTEFRKKFQL